MTGLHDSSGQAYCSGMSNKTNPRQLVLRCDSATGLAQVGWETDLPLGRFEHLELICESHDYTLPDIRSEHHAAYQAALVRARQANSLMLQQQTRHHQASGWYRVPFALAPPQAELQADSVGSYTAAAMQLHFILTQNIKQAWAVIQTEEIVHLRARYPLKELDELSYQVWYHQQCHQLQHMGGSLLEGELRICESGLWFSTSA